MATIGLRVSIAAAAAALVAGPLAAAPLVVRSLGPSAKSYPPGRAVGETPLVLKAGDVVTVLAPSGARILRGPGTFKVAGGGTAPPFNPRSRFGAMRGDEKPPTPGLFDIDVSRGGNVCLADARQALLWRPTSAAEATLELAPAGGSGQKLAWAAGSMMQRWPLALPIADGAEYSVKFANEAAARNLKIKTLAAVGDDPTALAKALIDAGCDAQLDLLIKAAPAE